ncbi:MAG: hypothetical protein K2L22_08805 [Muribaculaceae bacterium]|nr:hypothetical protein [Muribaculaceae bacterium]
MEYEEKIRIFANYNLFAMEGRKSNSIREVLEQPPILTLYEIAKILNVPPFELLNPESKDELKKVRKSTKDKS